MNTANIAAVICFGFGAANLLGLPVLIFIGKAIKHGRRKDVRDD